MLNQLKRFLTPFSCARDVIVLEQNSSRHAAISLQNGPKLRELGQNEGRNVCRSDQRKKPENTAKTLIFRCFRIP